MQRFALALVCCFLTGPSFGQDKEKPLPAEKQKIQDLIDQLASPRFAERAAATKALEAIGAPARDQLRQAAKHADVEISLRAARLLRLLEERAMVEGFLRPRLVRLDFQDTPAPDAVAALAKLSGYPVQLSGADAALAQRKITLKTGEVPFWDALQQLCDNAGLTEAVKATNQPVGNDQLVPILLTDGRSQAATTIIAGSVRLRVLPVQRAPGNADQVQLVVEVAAEPRLKGFGALGVARVDKAMDDRGQVLAEVPVPVPVSQPTSPFGRRGGVGQMVSSNHAAGVQGQPTAQVRLKLGEQAARSLHELSGRLTVQALAETEALLSIPNIMQAAGQSAKSDDGAGLHIKSVEKLGNGDVQIQLTMNLNPPQNPFAGRLVGNVQINGNNIQIGGWSPSGVWPTLVDAKGQHIVLAQAGNNGIMIGPGGVTRNATLIYRPRPGQEPAQLVQYGQRLVAFSVPFALKNLPLP